MVSTNEPEITTGVELPAIAVETESAVIFDCWSGSGTGTLTNAIGAGGAAAKGEKLSVTPQT